MPLPLPQLSTSTLLSPTSRILSSTQGTSNEALVNRLQTEEDQRLAQFIADEQEDIERAIELSNERKRGRPKKQYTGKRGRPKNSGGKKKTKRRLKNKSTRKIKRN